MFIHRIVKSLRSNYLRKDIEIVIDCYKKDIENCMKVLLKKCNHVEYIQKDISKNCQFRLIFILFYTI